LGFLYALFLSFSLGLTLNLDEEDIIQFRPYETDYLLSLPQSFSPDSTSPQSLILSTNSSSSTSFVWHYGNDSETFYLESLDHPGEFGYIVLNSRGDQPIGFSLLKKDAAGSSQNDYCFRNIIEKWRINCISLEPCLFPGWYLYWAQDLELTFKKSGLVADDDYKNRTSFEVILREEEGMEDDRSYWIWPHIIATFINIVITVISIFVMKKQGYSLTVIITMVIGMLLLMGLGMYVGMVLYMDIGMIIGMFIGMFIGMVLGMVVGHFIEKYIVKPDIEKPYSLMQENVERI